MLEKCADCEHVSMDGYILCVCCMYGKCRKWKQPDVTYGEPIDDEKKDEVEK